MKKDIFRRDCKYSERVCIEGEDSCKGCNCFMPLKGSAAALSSPFSDGLEGGWRKIADELPKPFVPVLLKFETGARRIGEYCFPGAGFISYGYKQKWKLQPIEWHLLPE